jgi:hypothetical protein
MVLDVTSQEDGSKDTCVFKQGIKTEERKKEEIWA